MRAPPSPYPFSATRPAASPGKPAADRARLPAPRRAPMSTANNFRAASGLTRWPAPVEDLAADDPLTPPRGPGLFEVARANGESLITNVRRIAGAERAPGSRLVLAVTILLGLLAAALFVVTLNAQYKYIFAAKG